MEHALHGICQTLLNPRADDQTVDDYFDIVLNIFIK